LENAELKPTKTQRFSAMLNHSDTSNYLPAFISKMEAAGVHPVVIETFSFYYSKILTGETGLVSGRDIEPVAAGEV
jgi:hypothetical protein